ncbi:molybdopterin-dependent oxidoreductase [Chloroflexota bacterium]
MDKAIRAICYGCWLECGVKAYVEDGQVTRLTGDPDDLRSKGFFCERGARFIEHLYHPDRLNYPLKRIGERGGGKWEKISIKQALDEISEKLAGFKEKYGAETIATTCGTGRGHQEIFKDRFMYLFGSPNTANAGQFCRVNYRMLHYAIYGADVAGFRPLNMTRGCLVLWGHNPEQSEPLEYKFLRDVKRKGGVKFIVIDPKRTKTVDEFADLWLPLRPGTDAALALGWINIIIDEKLYDKEFVANWCYGFDKLKERAKAYPPERVSEITWLPKEIIIESARLYGRNKPSAIPWGLRSDMQGRNVTSTIQSIAILRALTGSLYMSSGSPLAGPCPKANCGTDFTYVDLLPEEQRGKQLGSDRHRFWTFPGYELILEAMRPYYNGKAPSSYMPGCHEPDIWHAIITGKPYPINALLTGGNNPLLAFANTKKVYRALESKNLGLFVVLEQWMTPTAMLADYVIPVTNWLEMPVLGYYTYSGFQDYVTAGEQVVQPLYERVPDYYFWRGLGIRLGQEKFWRNTLKEEWEWVIKPLLDELKIGSYGEFVEKIGSWFPTDDEKPYEKIDLRSKKLKGFGTATGKVELYCTILDKLGYDPLPHYEEPPETPISAPQLSKEYPLILITGTRFKPFHHSEHRQLYSARNLYPEPTVEIHPDTAREAGIKDGEWTIIETPRGKIKQRAKLSIRIQPNVVDVQHGWWFPEEIPDKPVLYRAFESNANILTPNSDEYVDPPTGAACFSPLLCKIYPAKKYYGQ